MSQKRPSTWGNPDHRCQTQLPAPPIAQIEQQLFSLLNPGSFKPLRLAQGEKKMPLPQKTSGLPLVKLTPMHVGAPLLRKSDRNSLNFPSSLAKKILNQNCREQSHRRDNHCYGSTYEFNLIFVLNLLSSRYPYLYWENYCCKVLRCSSGVFLEGCWGKLNKFFIVRE